MERYFVFNGKQPAVAHGKMNNDTVKRLWKSFCLTDGELEVKEDDGFVFRLGDTALPELPAGKEYALSVTETGAAVVGKDYGGLVRGFLCLLMKIEYGEDTFKIKAVEEQSEFTVKNRMIHICVFPENDLYYIKRLIRLCGLCQYTHIVLEFWGMLRFDCLPELAWPHAFTKDEVRELIKEARELGMEPVPMFNELGHASQSRCCNGKHTILDQNPRLRHLFTPDGWAWNLHSEEVFDLFKKVRGELYELFGEGEYIHIGCDEAYYYTHHDGEREHLHEHLSKLTSDVAREGRRPMLWMDMMIEAYKHPNTTASCRPEDVERFIGALHPSTVAVDWQYYVTKADVPSTMELSARGLDVIGAPWCEGANYEAVVTTVSNNDLHGVMLTTWHRLKEKMPSILGCAKKMGAITFPWSLYNYHQLHTETATLLRRVSFEGNSYADSGWAKEQIDI